jgi:hypothetical protein
LSVLTATPIEGAARALRIAKMASATISSRRVNPSCRLLDKDT